MWCNMFVSIVNFRRGSWNPNPATHCRLALLIMTCTCVLQHLNILCHERNNFLILAFGIEGLSNFLLREGLREGKTLCHGFWNPYNYGSIWCVVQTGSRNNYIWICCYLPQNQRKIIFLARRRLILAKVRPWWHVRQGCVWGRHHVRGGAPAYTTLGMLVADHTFSSARGKSDIPQTIQRKKETQ